MDEVDANTLLEMTRADPVEAHGRIDDALRDDALDDAVASILLRAKGLASRWASTITDSIDALDAAIDRAIAADRDDLVGEARLTLSGSLYLGGDLDGALEQLDRASERAPVALAAKVDYQRATILARAGNLERAVAAFDQALDRFDELGDAFFVASTLCNRGNAQLERGNAALADRDLHGAQDAFRVLGLDVSVAWMEHNLGRVAGWRGDVVTALRRFRVSETALTALGVDVSEVQVNRCDVLLQAGLFEEAEAVAAGSESAMSDAGLELDRGEAVLARALALLGQGRYEHAREQAKRARAIFDEQQRRPWSLRAAVVDLRGSADDRTVQADADDAVGVARELAEAGQLLASAHAWAVAARSRPSAAVDGLAALEFPRRGAPLEFRLAELEVLATARLAAGDAAGAKAATRAAAEIVERHRLTLGASDLRAAVSAQVVAISQLGLTIRRDAARPWELVRWVDRTRSASIDVTTSVPGADSEVGDLLAELRAAQQASRHADPTEALGLASRQASVQRRLTLAGRLVAGRSSTVRGRLPRRLRDVGASATVVQYHRDHDRVGAVVIDRDGVRIVDLAPIDEVDRTFAFLTHGLRRLLAGRDGALTAVQRDAASLADLLVPAVEDRPLVVVPLPQHVGVPWAMLPSLAGRPVTVTPSLRHWLRTRTGSAAAGSRVGLVHGPELRSGATETEGLVRIWGDLDSLAGAHATPDAVFGLLERVDVAHVACHCDRRHGDGRFAQLRLHDADLTAFDLERLRRAPSLVVLSGCESGLVDALPGEESSGVATALFNRGAATVIGATIKLPDTEATAALFVDLHERLHAGRPPSVALYEAQQAVADPAGRIVAQAVGCFGGS